MYKLLSVNPTGMFSYGPHRTIPLDGQGSVLLDGINLDRNGNSNGSGKTSFFHAICHILYGKNPSGEAADSIVNESYGKYFGRVVFLDKNDVKWRITDVRKWRKTDKYPTEKFNEGEEPSEIHQQNLRYSGTDVFLERWDEGGGLWIDERSSNKNVGDARLDLKATRKKIVDILDIDYDQFMSVAYLAQQQTMRFIAGTHKERLQVLAELSDLKAWDARVTKIREDIAEKDSEKDRLNSKLAGLGQLVFTKPDPEVRILIHSSIGALLLQMDRCDEQLKDIVERSTAWKMEQALLEANINKILNRIKDAQLQQQNQQNKLDLAAREYARDCEIIRQAPRPHEIAKLETEISELNGQITARKWDLEQLLVGAGQCPRCRTTVKMEHILRHRELLTLDIRVLGDSVVDNKNRLNKIIGEWEVDVKERLDARTIEFNETTQNANDQLNQWSVALNSHIDAFESEKKKQSGLGQDPKFESGIIEQKRLTLLAQKSMKEMELKNWNEQADRFNDYEAVVSKTRAQVTNLEFEIKHLRVLERMFGDKGIKAFKLDNILGILNQSLDKYIDIITDGSVKVWVTQYREKGDGELATDLQVLVREGHKHEVPLALYSGGERQQITLAFIGAFWNLASRCGSGVNILCLDEIFGPLDEFNIGNVLLYLDHMRSNGKSSVFIVTHNENMKNQVAFDKVWTITKKDHMSTLAFN